MQTKIKYLNYSQALYYSRLLSFVDIVIFTDSITDPRIYVSLNLFKDFF